MSKMCAKCQKVVYPTEELKCLDKTWHKGCFKCWSCGMSLNMKNYKGYDKLPYCNAHYPKTGFTQVTDTPELNRLQQLTRDQSTVVYHKEFEKDKGKFTVVADTPENTRLRETQDKISLVKYHKDYERMKGMKTSVTDDPELERHKFNTTNISNVEYTGHRDRRTTQEQHRDLVGIGMGQHNMQKQPPGMGDYGGEEQRSSMNNPSPYTARGQGTSTAYSAQGRVEQTTHAPRPVGSIVNYDPLNNQYGSIAADEWVETVPDPTAQRAAYTEATRIPYTEPAAVQRSQPPAPRSPEPASGDLGGSNGVPAPSKVPLVPLGQPLSLMVHTPTDQPHYPAAVPVAVPEPTPPQQPAGGSNSMQGAVYKAMYDYDAADNDEVSFREDDLIIYPEPIDAGWMYGQVKRTGQSGMLPANYVELVQ